jgi:hypothetical protein
LNLQSPSSPIASEGEESMEIEYGDTSFSGFNFDYDSIGGTSPSHPPPFKLPPLVHSHDDEEEEKGKED